VESKSKETKPTPEIYSLEGIAQEKMEKKRRQNTPLCTEEQQLTNSPRVSSFSSSSVSIPALVLSVVWSNHQIQECLRELLPPCEYTCFARLLGRSLLDLALVVIVLEEADDGADTAGAKTVGRVADYQSKLV
jgi:hypothetical protein